MKGLEQRRIQSRIGAQVDRVKVLVEVTRVRKDQHHFLASSWSGGWALKVGGDGVWILQNNSRVCARLIFTVETELGVFISDLLSLLLLLLLPGYSRLFLHSFISLRSLITETCSRASVVARLRSQNDLGQKWLMSRKPCLILFLRGPPTLSACPTHPSATLNMLIV